MSVEARVRWLYQAWKQTDYDPMQGRPDLVELIIKEFNISREEAAQMIQEIDKYPK